MPGRLPPLESRRKLLQCGGLATLGLTLPDLLRADASDSASSPRSCIFIVQYGGCSHIDSFDLKPDAPDDIRGPFQPISTSVPGTQIGELLPRLGTLADRYAIVRSMTHGNGGHDGGMHVAMTGHSQPAASTPYFGSIVARALSPLGNIPPYVWLQNLAGDVEPRYLGGGFLGPACSPLRVGTDLDNPSAPEFRFTAFDPIAGLGSDSLRARRELLNQIQPSAASAAGGDEFTGFQERAFNLVTGTEARQAFELEHEQPETRDRYGRHPLGQNLLLARRLIEAGVRLVSVTAWCGVAEGEKFTNVQTWDMHGPAAAAHLGSIFGNGSFGLGFALPRVDQSVSALLEDLDARGMLDSTLVVMVGEFGRSPRIVKEGRDHWPACYSALLAGAGVRGGLVYGASDKSGGSVQEALVTPEDFGATLLSGLGIDPGMRLGRDGFTHPASTGQVVTDLFASGGA
jgi:hypothetical protein